MMSHSRRPSNFRINVDSGPAHESVFPRNSPAPRSPGSSFYSRGAGTPPTNVYARLSSPTTTQFAKSKRRYQASGWLEAFRNAVAAANYKAMKQARAAGMLPRHVGLLVTVFLIMVYFVAGPSRSGASTKVDVDKAIVAIQKGEAPPVSRDMMERLRLLEIHVGADAEDLDEGRHHTRRPYVPGQAAPPVVEVIPEPVKGAAYKNMEKVPADVLDPRYCPGQEGPCSFLVPAWIGEQETKAQMHLYELGLLAVALNRTLVLPNVSKARMGVCYNYPFSFYYEPNSLEQLGIPTITQAQFLEWVDRREQAPSGQIISMVSSKSQYKTGAIEIDSASDPTLIPGRASRKHCLTMPKSRVDFSNYSPLGVYPPEGYHKSEPSRVRFGDSVINTLRNRGVSAKSSRASSQPDAPYTPPNILAFNYELRFPIFNPATIFPDGAVSFTNYEYTSIWSDIAIAIAETLSPFVAIHWRTETLGADNLTPCVNAMMDALSEVRKQYPDVANVYLATDYPVETLEEEMAGVEAVKAVAHSGTFGKVVTEQHHAAFRTLLRDFPKKVKGMRLTSFAKEQASLDLPDDLLNTISAQSGGGDAANILAQLGNLDSGLLGIIDKSVAMRAEVFMTGLTVAPPGGNGNQICGKISSFTRQITESRQRLKADQADEETVGVPGKIWEDVRYWHAAKRRWSR